MYPRPVVIPDGDPAAVLSRLGINAPGSLQHMPNRPQGLSGLRFRPFGTPETCDAPVFEEHRYARLGGTQVFAVSQANTLILPESNGLRNFLMVRNSSAAANIYIDFQRDADAFSVLRLTANTIVLWDTVVPQDQMTAFADAAAGFLSLWVATIPGQTC